MIPCSETAPSPSLPPELLQLVAGKLTDVVDYISFRGVCKSWRSAARPGDAPKQLPWLLLPYNPAAPIRSFYSLSTARTYSFDCGAAVVGRVVCGSSFGWLVLIASDSVISLWNPVTKATMALPPPTGFPSYLGPEAPRLLAKLKNRDVDEHCFPRALYCIRRGYPCRVSLSSSPADPDCVVLVILSLSSTFAYCRIGDRDWTIRETNLPHHVNSVVLHDGRFYVLDCFGAGVILDVDDPSARSDIPFSCGCLPLFGTFIAKVADDNELYMVHSYMGVLDDDPDEEYHRVDVFKLVNWEEEGYRWGKIDSVGDLAFFLSGNHASVVRATDCPRSRRDHVYFSEEDWGYVEFLKKDGHDICVYDINRGRFQRLPRQTKVVSDFSRSPTWVMPSLLEML
ncbi:uncharacterized protein M6B38_270755 [Iris pallida]|uniref:KIB1-4 beta-propeller domain-containing protein n=1 Tax=Iris pallida TaxID=29817 RepID=A0AAX6I9Q7_IRIPA|nr:uncharacterized protein M6B38_270755 [Iris pallida]